MAGQPRKTLHRVTQVQELLSEAGETFWEMTPRAYLDGTRTGEIVDVWFELQSAIQVSEKHAKKLIDLLEEKIHGSDPPREPRLHATPLGLSALQEPASESDLAIAELTSDDPEPDDFPEPTED